MISERQRAAVTPLWPQHWGDRVIDFPEQGPDAPAQQRKPVIARFDTEIDLGSMVANTVMFVNKGDEIPPELAGLPRSRRRRST